MAVISIGNTQLGLIVRGKENDLHKPGVMAQHADAILTGGMPIGFFGGEGDASSGSSGSDSSGFSASSANGPSISLNSTGMNMTGLVADYDKMARIRPFYIDAALARRYGVESTVIILDVTAAQAALFNTYWRNLKLNPGAFSLLGANCSTHVSEAFVESGILTGGIPGLDTPDNLYRQLKAKAAGHKAIHSGYVGFTKISGNRYDLVVE